MLLAGIAAQVPDGYYDSASGLSGASLHQALHDIIDNHTVVSYTALWTHFQVTDKKYNGKVWDMYSDIPSGTPPYEFTFITNQCGNYASEGDCYNREHSFPKSWFNDASPMYSDLFHLYPTDGYVNGRRGNYPYGEVGTASWTSQNGSKLGGCSCPGYSGMVFEPIDAYKGDLARTYFYMSTRYYGEDSGWDDTDMTDGAQLDAWALALLLDWHRADSVSQKETDRNDAVYGIQGNRNPFIDHPEFVDAIWDPVGIVDMDNRIQPRQISLSPAWPNPFNPSTNFTVLVDRSAAVKIEVLDITGRTIFDYGNTDIESGSHSVAWDGITFTGQPAPSGIYFIRAVSGRQATAIKIALTK